MGKRGKGGRAMMAGSCGESTECLRRFPRPGGRVARPPTSIAREIDDFRVPSHTTPLPQYMSPVFIRSANADGSTGASGFIIQSAY